MGIRLGILVSGPFKYVYIYMYIWDLGFEVCGDIRRLGGYCWGEGIIDDDPKMAAHQALVA